MLVSTLYLSAAALLAPLAVSASPLPRATTSGSGNTDTDTVTVEIIVQYEQLCTTFYQQAVNKFKPTDYTSAGFSSGDAANSIMTTIQFEESTHSSAVNQLSSLGGTQGTCTFNTMNYLTSVEVMVSTSLMLEYMGTGMYSGVATMINDPNILSVTEHISVSESSHQNIMNIFQGSEAAPQAFYMPLTITEVVTIFQTYLSGPCNLGVTPHIALTITNTETVTSGTSLTFDSSALTGSASTSASCQMFTSNNAPATVLPINKCVVPPGITGTVLVYITDTAAPLSNEVVTRQTQTNVIAGPAMVNINIQDSFGQGFQKTG